MAQKDATKKSNLRPIKTTLTKSAKNPPVKTPVANAPDAGLREHLISMLEGEGAHATFDQTLEGWPLQFAGIKVAKFPHTAWMLLEHIRLAQLDLLEFSRNSKYVSPKWPDEYWPQTAAPPNEQAWTRSIEACKKDLKAMQRLVKDQKTDLFAKIPWGDGQTILREAIIMADHNSYHVGQMMLLRKSLGF